MKKIIRTRATRNDWLKNIYAAGLVRADDETRRLADKLCSYQWIKERIGDQIDKFIPLTIGLREFVVKNEISLEASESAIADLRAALERTFPRGCFLKPCDVINTGGETAGYFISIDEIIEAFKSDAAVRQAALRAEPYSSKLLGQVVSGEEFVLQENVPQAAGLPPKPAKSYTEVRVHTFENKVVPYGVYSRWKVNQTEALTLMEEMFSYSRDFLKCFPEGSLAGHAWSLDILVFENGYARIIDINTNRGEKVQWSGFLSRPQVIGAYTRFFEREKGVRFSGWQGFLLRNNWGNYWKYKKKYYIEGIR